MGVVSCLGTGCPSHAEALATGRDGLRVTQRFDTAAFVSGYAGTWPAWDGRRQLEPTSGQTLLDTSRGFSAVEMALVAVREAFANAGLNAQAIQERRVALVLGTCFGQGFSEFHEITDAVAQALGLRGPHMTISTACSSSTNAIGFGRDLLRRGRADLVVAGGVDLLLREGVAGFNALGALSSQTCAPFGQPFGTTLAEGAGFVVLEPHHAIAQREGDVLCTIDGYALSSDAHHETSPDPTGSGIERAIRWALHDAGLGSDQIDHVNAHASGTESNDRTEWSAIARALPDRAIPVPVSGLKGFVGHTMGAAGVIELILAILALRQGKIPPTLRSIPARVGAAPDPVPGTSMRSAKVRRAIKISAAFGGANAVIVYGDPAHPAPAVRATSPARVQIRGVAALTPLGAGWAPNLPRSDAPIVGRIPDFDLAACIPTADPRGLDRSGRLLTAVSALALGDAKIILRGRAHETAGLFVAATRMPAESSARCQKSLLQHGSGGMSASAFARMSVNAPAGACAKHLGLKGPCTTISTGAGSGLAAIAWAADGLSHRTDAHLLLACAVDEIPAGRDDLFEGAVCTVLSRVERQTPIGAAEIYIAGVGMSGAGDLETAVREALNDAPPPDGILGDSRRSLEFLAGRLGAEAGFPWGLRSLGDQVQADASTSALAFVEAVLCLRRGEARSLLVTSALGPSMASAILLRRNEP